MTQKILHREVVVLTSPEYRILRRLAKTLKKPKSRVFRLALAKLADTTE